MPEVGRLPSGDVIGHVIIGLAM